MSISYSINHHCKVCGLCDIISGGKISFFEIDVIAFREAAFEAERDYNRGVQSDNRALIDDAYNRVKEMLSHVKHTGATESQVRQIAKECYVNALEIIE
jgi:hypothetical protein